MKRFDCLNIFKKTGALLSGHFLLTSGLHSENYMQCAQVLQYPVYSEMLCAALAEKFAKFGINVVIGPALGGVIVSYEVARQLKARNLFAERDKEGKMLLRRNFSLSPEDKVLVVEDVITTGGSVKEVISLVRDSGSKLVGVGCIVDRSHGNADFGVPLKGLLKIDFKTYEAKDCPMCAKGLVPIKPGSRK